MQNELRKENIACARDERRDEQPAIDLPVRPEGVIGFTEPDFVGEIR